MKTLKMNEKLQKKSMGGTYKITRFSAANSPREAHLLSYNNNNIGLQFVPSLEDYDKYQLRYEQFCRCTSLNFSALFHFYLMFC